MFPRIQGANLERRPFLLPDDFEGERNLVLIAFMREQQLEIDSWISTAKRLTQDHSNFRYYELPTISRGIPLARWWLDGAMRAGTSDRAAREATITLYVNKQAFREALQLQTEDTIYVLLVNRTGRVLWRTEGVSTNQKVDALKRVLSAPVSS